MAEAEAEAEDHVQRVDREAVEAVDEPDDQERAHHRQQPDHERKRRGAAAAEEEEGEQREEREREQLGAAEIAVDLIADLLAGDGGAAERHARHVLETMGRAGDDVGLVGRCPQRRGDQRRRPVRGDQRASAGRRRACARPRPPERRRARARPAATRSRAVRARRAARRVDDRDEPGRRVEAAGLLDRLPGGDRRRARVLEPVGGVELPGNRAPEDRGDDEGQRALR